MIRLICVLKRLDLCPLDRDRTVAMHSSPFYLSRYNPFNLGTCVDHLHWTPGTSEQRAMIDLPLDPRP